MITLIGCRSLEPLNVEQCTIDIEAKTCACRKYKLSKNYTGPVGSFIDSEYSKCQRIIGYDPITYVNVNHFIKDLAND